MRSRFPSSVKQCEVDDVIQEKRPGGRYATGLRLATAGSGPVPLQFHEAKPASTWFIKPLRNVR